MTIAMRTVIRPHLLLDAVTGELLQDRDVVIPLHDIRLLENAVLVMKDGVVQHHHPDTQGRD
jgi:hypothetical protein